MFLETLLFNFILQKIFMVPIMKTNKKVIISILGILLFLLICFSIPLLKTESSNIFKFAEWGKYLSGFSNVEKNSSLPNDTLMVGTYGVITKSDVAQAKQFYILKGLSESDAETEALQHTKEREALYQAAIRNGFTVTDKEVYSYLDELKKTIDQADNKEDAYAIIDQFESEDAYWNFEFTVYKKDLPIQKYVSSLEQSYNQGKLTDTNNSIDANAEKSDNGWVNDFEQLKIQLVEDENFHYIK